MTRSPRELATQKIQIRKQQETLLRDLLTVVDALDHAADHWHQADASHVSSVESQANASRKPSSSPSSDASQSVISRIQQWLQKFGIVPTPVDESHGDRPPNARSESRASTEENDAPTLAEVVTSARDGIDLIRESMMTVLNKHQVVPIAAKGEPFDPTYMNALGQQSDGQVPPNTVIQEVVRGYRWQDRVLREAQVIVAVSPAAESEPPDQ
jgi:molecular chaperone GrpE